MILEQFVSEIKGWKIWYSTGEPVCSTSIPWQKAPSQDVQVVMLYYNKKDGLSRNMRQIFHGQDYYYLNGGCFEISNDNSDIVDLENLDGMIKYGKWTTAENLHRIVKNALEDYI